MALVNKTEAMTQTMKIIGEHRFESREEVIRWHKEWKLTPGQSQNTLAGLAQHLLDAWKTACQTYGLEKAHTKLDKKIIDATMSMWSESLELDWMTALNDGSEVNVATAEYKHID